ncbi:aminotransferase class V-fold PLP-dependent enzyme [Streptomyces sp. NPDC087512]|uniref:aminotransferase class V-fold PLP-dependent enzyme n=1 Tax=Streptomyces sp. NPDC087512 TaxID=3155059 RepID=UPI00341E6D38
MKPQQFRDLFPALATTVWLDTPGSPPGALPVTRALAQAVAGWSSGDFDWLDWDAACDEARQLFARFIKVPAQTVSTLGSLSEAAATVAGSLPEGRIVLSAADFRSNLLPWQKRHDVVLVPPRDGGTHIDDLIAALDRDTVLLAVSEVTSGEGQRLDLQALRRATDRVGVRLFVNLTQSLGALHYDQAVVQADYVAVHGYKWLLCPRGAAWLVTREDRVDDLQPLAASWKSTGRPAGYFGAASLAADASRCDVSPSWFSWIGACAALPLFASLDPQQVETHVLHLAGLLTDEAENRGLERVASGPCSHIVALRTDDAAAVAARLRVGSIRATALEDRVRFGFHYFNTEQDVVTALKVLS